MSAAVSVVICADELGALLEETLESVARQRGLAIEVLLAHDDAGDGRRRQALGDLARRRSVRLIQAATTGPGAVRNAGVRASGASRIVMLDPGDLLARDYVQQAAAQLDAEADRAFVTSWAWMESPDGRSFVAIPPGTELATLLARPDAISTATMFRRAAWEALGGFDESLASLELYDFWIRLLAGGHRGAILEAALVHQRIHEGSRYRRTFAPTTYAAGMRVLYAKHRELFAENPAAVLGEQERYIRELIARHESLERRRAARLDELGVLDQEIMRLEALGGAGSVAWGDFRRLSPLSGNWGYDRGKPIDRHYIERFLAHHAADVHGTVLEVQERDYTMRFGGARVDRSDVVDIDPANARATIVADLRDAPGIPADAYDCIILTQTLHVIDDVRAVLAQCFRILKPGGVLLATLPCLSRVCLEYGEAGDFWRVTEAGARKLFSAFFAAEGLEIHAYGNVLASAAFLYGLAAHELTPAELDAFAPYFPLLVAVRAVKPGSRPPPADVSAGARAEGVRVRPEAGPIPAAAILLYHRVAEAASDVHGLCVNPADFREQMRYLSRHYRLLALEDLVADLERGTEFPGSVAVTFDDGYLDNLAIASPILLESRVPATFFVDSGYLDETQTFWWDTLARIFVSGRPIPETLEVELVGRRTRFPTATAEARMATHAALHRALVTASLDERDGAIQRMAAWSGLDLAGRRADRRMTGTEIRCLSERPRHAIGGHGAHHLALPAQPLPVKQQEVLVNKAHLEHLIGRAVLAFSYPFGACDEESVAVVRAASFRLAVTCEPTSVGPAPDPLRLPRLEVTTAGGEGFTAFLARHLAAGSRPARPDS